MPRLRTAQLALARWTAWWVGLAALWMLLDDTVAFPELMAGAGAATVGATAAEIVHAQGLVRLRPRVSWLRGAWRLPVGLFADTGRLIAVLYRVLVLRREVRGSFRTVSFRAGGADAPHDVARRALAKFSTSFAPNTYAIGIDVEDDVMLVHQLESTGKPTDVDPLGLR